MGFACGVVSQDPAIQPAGPGDPLPWLVLPSSVNPRFHFDTLAGRYVVLCCLGSGAHPLAEPLLAAFARRAALFDDRRTCLFAVSVDPQEPAGGRGLPEAPWLRWFYDGRGQLSRALGALTLQHYRQQTVVLDERLRVFAVLPCGDDPEAHAAAVAALLSAAPAPGTSSGGHAPVLVLPRVFEPELCQRLMAFYDAGGAGDSGFMQERDGRTVGVYDYSHKRRSDKLITDEALQALCRSRIQRRLVPEVARAFQFQATRLERHLVACYEAETGGHFAPHRDNTTSGTAHRRIAVSVVLNSGAFDGGELCFPEYGPSTYSPPAGGAVVFSCSVLHQATRVTRGRRYCYLPFLYGEAADAVRQRNLHRLAGDEAPPPAAQPAPA